VIVILLVVPFASTGVETLGISMTLNKTAIATFTGGTSR
jgi:hypothetical protein